MSKIISTSGSHPPLVKGAGPAGDGTGDGASAVLFAALFGGMKLAGADAGADEAQAEIVTPEEEMVLDPHLVQMLAAAGKGHVQTDAETADTDTEEDTEADFMLALADLNSSDDEMGEERVAEAGLLSVASTPSEVRPAHPQPAQRSPLAAIAEDMKQDTADAKGGQAVHSADLSDQDPEFIGPPVPRTLAKQADRTGVQINNSPDLRADIARARAAAGVAASAARSQDAGIQPEADLDTGADALAIDAAKLKADRMPENGVRSASGPSASAPAQQAELQAGLTSGGGQNGFTQGGGQQSGTGSAFAGTPAADSFDQWLDVLDMQDENWTEQLVRRIDREMRSGGNGLDLELNPRNLGRLRVNLSVVQDQTNVVLRTETGTAAQMITDAETRLSQMLEQAGLKLGQFEAFSGGQNRGFGQQQGGQGQSNNQGQLAGTEPETDGKTGDTGLSDGLVNLTA